jgi:hypothetical protein
VENRLLELENGATVDYLLSNPAVSLASQVAKAPISTPGDFAEGLDD